MVLSVEDNYRDQPARRARGLAAQRLESLMPYLSPGPADEPWFLSRDPMSIVGPRGALLKPAACEQLDCGVSLALVIGRRCHRLEPADAWGAVLGVTVALDVVRRDLPGGQGSLARSYPTHTPLGPAVVPLDEAAALAMTLTVNGRTVQRSSTSEMVASPAALLCAITRRVPLAPGDVVLTGTPGGTFAERGDGWLDAGDRIAAEVEGVGRLEMTVVPEERL